MLNEKELKLVEEKSIEFFNKAGLEVKLDIRYREEERYSFKIPPISFLGSWDNAINAVPAPEKKPNLLLLLEDNI